MDEIIYKNIDKYPRVKRICLTCNKEFFAIIYAVKKGKGNYCSNSCSKRQQSESGNGVEYIITHRDTLGKAYVITKCQQCGVEFEVLLRKLKIGEGKYCSRSCASIAETPKIKKALNHHLQVEACNAVKLALKAGKLKRTETCSICGCKELSPRLLVLEGRKRIIEFHHHDYSKPLDVVEMCQSCHWKEHYRLQREEDIQEV